MKNWNFHEISKINDAFKELTGPLKQQTQHMIFYTLLLTLRLQECACFWQWTIYWFQLSEFSSLSGVYLREMKLKENICWLVSYWLKKSGGWNHAEFRLLLKISFLKIVERVYLENFTELILCVIQFCRTNYLKINQCFEIYFSWQTKIKQSINHEDLAKSHIQTQQAFQDRLRKQKKVEFLFLL